MIKTGIDIGSTTVKVIATDETGRILYSRYERHNAKAGDVLSSLLKELLSRLGDQDTSIKITGSVGMGFAEKYSLPFIQEVVAAAKAIQKHYPHTASMIDIGGEDAKIVFFKDGKPADLRMNGNCAGGTGAFIDQMAVLLGVDLKELNALAAACRQPISDSFALRRVLQDRHTESHSQKREPERHCGIHTPCRGRTDGHNPRPRA